MIECRGCHRACPLDDFRPASIERETRKRVKFDAALARIREEDATSESHPHLFAELDACRTKKCTRCKESMRRTQNNPNTLTGQCKFFWYELREVPCHDCKRDDGFTEYDHQADRGPKIHNVGDYSWWIWHGGVEAMRAEAAKCIPRCRNCHQLQGSNNKYKRKYATLEEMPTETRAQRIAKHQRMVIDEKIAFVDARKMEIGKCADCELAVWPEACHIFVFAHIDASTKTEGVARICNRHHKLETARPMLEEEMAKCRLLCCVCHSKETRERNAQAAA